jgi:hypothetical protein
VGARIPSASSWILRSSSSAERSAHDPAYGHTLADRAQVQPVVALLQV